MDIQEVDIKFELMLTEGVCNTVVYFAKLQFQNGLRISDLLKIKRNDILPNGTVVVKQSKGSLPLYCGVANEFQFWAEYAGGCHTDIMYFSRNYFYRLYKRYALTIFSENGGNNSVTHSGRKMVAQMIYRNTKSLEATQAALGQKSSRSTLYYLTEQQRMAEQKQGVTGKVDGNVGNLNIRTVNGVQYVSLRSSPKKKTK